MLPDVETRRLSKDIKNTNYLARRKNWLLLHVSFEVMELTHYTSDAHNAKEANTFVDEAHKTAQGRKKKKKIVKTTQLLGATRDLYPNNLITQLRWEDLCPQCSELSASANAHLSFQNVVLEKYGKNCCKGVAEKKFQPFTPQSRPNEPFLHHSSSRTYHP